MNKMNRNLTLFKCITQLHKLNGLEETFTLISSSKGNFVVYNFHGQTSIFIPILKFLSPLFTSSFEDRRDAPKLDHKNIDESRIRKSKNKLEEKRFNHNLKPVTERIQQSTQKIVSVTSLHAHAPKIERK